MELWDKSVVAVYEISNVINGKRYIGSSGRVKKRWCEHRAKLAASRVGKTLSAETKFKIGAYSRGKPWTPERRAAQPHTYAKCRGGE